MDEQRKTAVPAGQTDSRGVRVGVLWRGDRGDTRPREDRGLGPLFDAFSALSVQVVPIPFAEDRVEAARAQVRGLDGVLVWVNPIQDGVNRGHVDALLRDAAATGTWVSANPDVIARMGTKEVLFETRHLDWGTDTDLYRSVGELAERLPARLERHGRLVVKQGRGNGGIGVWSVELVHRTRRPALRSRVAVREARAVEGSPVDEVTLGEFLRRCEPYFDWSGVLVDQPYQRRLAEGMIRCYFSHDEVVGFCHQRPRGLLDTRSRDPLPRPPSAMEGPDAPAFQQLRRRAERQWVPEMARVLGLDRRDLPVVWDADFLFGTTEAGGEDRYVLCEINVSAVWPFPPHAASRIAANTVARVTEAARMRRQD